MVLACDAPLFLDQTTFCKETMITLELPVWPPSENGSGSLLYPELVNWIVEVHTASFTGKYECARGEKICLKVLKNETLSVTATPVCLDAKGRKVCFFKCAGLILPYYKFSESSTLLWFNGFSAHLMQSLFRNGKQLGYDSDELRNYISRFNWNKLEASIDSNLKKCLEDQGFYNPWLLDQTEVLNGIAYGSFKANLLNMKNVLKVDTGQNNEILSSYVPENENIKKNAQILIKKSEVNVFSDYNLNGIMIKGDSVQKLTLEYISLPLYIEEYEKTIDTSFSDCLNPDGVVPW